MYPVWRGVAQVSKISHGLERLAAPHFASFRKSRVHEAQHADIEADLAVLRAYGRRAWLRKLGATVLMVTSPVVAFAVAASGRNSDQPPLLILGALLFFVFLVTRWRQRPLVQKRIDLASAIHRRLATDPARPTAIKLDLASISAKRKNVGREQGRDIYQDPFLSLGIPLIGGTKVDVHRLEEMRFLDVRGQRVRRREWSFINTDMIELFVSSDEGDYRRAPGVDLSRVTQAQLQVPEGFAITQFEARPDRLRVAVQSRLRWDATPSGRLAAKHADAAGVIVELIGQMQAAAGLSLTQREPPPAAQVFLPLLSPRALAVVLVLLALGGLGLVFVSGSEIPQHYGYTQEHNAWDPDGRSADRLLQEDLIRTGGFAFCCCATPLFGALAVLLLARRRRARFLAGG